MIKTSHAFIISFIGMIILTTHYSNTMDRLYIENSKLQDRVWELEEALEIDKHNVTVTMYNPTRGQTDKTPNITADGTRINPNKATSYRYIALSRNLLKRWGGPFNYGDYVMIKGTGGYDGMYQVKDTMNPRLINRVDILRTAGSKWFKFENVTLYRYFKYDQVTLHKHEKP